MSELRNIRKRYCELLWSEAVPLPGEEAEKLFKTLIPGDAPDTLRWADLDYGAQNDAFWPAHSHLVRIKGILAFFGRERLTSDQDYASAIRRALGFWFAHDYASTNWWYNDIGVPMVMGDIAIMMDGVLDAESVRKATEWVAHGSAAQHPEMLETGPSANPKRRYWTGANLIWAMMDTIRHALLAEDEFLMKQAVARTEEEITVGQTEGIQADGSFFQHGPRLYSGGYGMAFAGCISFLAYLLGGSSFQFRREKLDVYLTHVLDGLYHMIHCGALDNACVGREITRPDIISGKTIRQNLRRMSETADLPRQDEIRRFLAAVIGGPQPDRTKFFPVAMYLCHHFDGLHVGAKYLNNKTWDAEICNGENPLAFNMSYGTHACIMRDGREYLNINPVWDFSRIPGTTARTETDEQLLAHADWWMRPLPSDHAGGAQEGSRAVVYELAQHDGVETLAASFAFEHGFVSMGCGVKCTERPEDLFTSVDQCFLRGKVSSDGKTVLHNGIRYTSLDGRTIDAEAAHRVGSWKRNSHLSDDVRAEGDVLTLTIRHPAGSESAYAFMISAESRPAPDVRLLRNDAGVQAILLPDGSVMAVFHRADCLEWDGKRLERGPGVYIGR